MQVHNLGLEKFSMENAHRIGNSIGRYIETDKDVENKSNSYLNLKVVVDTEKTLMARFWWQISQGDETWTNIKYERLSDFCYGCGRLGRTTQVCKEEVKISEIKEGHTMYGPWIIRMRPKNKAFAWVVGGRDKGMPKSARSSRRSLYDKMNEVREKESVKSNENLNKWNN